MEERNGNNYEAFIHRLRDQVNPIAHQLINDGGVSSIVWMQQAPIIAGLVHQERDNNFAAAKIRHYNAGVRHILKLLLLQFHVLN